MLSVGQVLHDGSRDLTVLTRISKMDDGEIWRVRLERADPPDTFGAVKVKLVADMHTEISYVLDHRDYLCERLFPWGAKFGVTGGHGWILMREYPHTLFNLPGAILETHWRHILTQCVGQLRAMHLSHYDKTSSSDAITRRFGWLHGDVKLNNILVDTDGTAAICDFGLSGHVTGCMQHKPPRCGGYFIKHAGAFPRCNWGPRCDLEALGIAMTVKLNHISVEDFYATRNQKEARVQLRVLEPRLGFYFEALDAAPWNNHIHPAIYDRLAGK